MGELRNICIVSGSRADYGLLYWLIRAVESDPELVLQFVVTGAHLNARFGETVREIERDGVPIAARVPILGGGDSRLETVHATAAALYGLAEAFDRLRPHCVIVLGDRYEILAAAEAAVMLAIPLAHVHGGEVTEGALDECFRHAISKFAHLHFASAEPYRRRIIQMGEDPSRVITVGAPGVEYIRRLKPMGREAVDRLLGRALRDPTFLVTYHPVTAGAADPAAGAEALVAALHQFPNSRVVVTGVNADPGNCRVAEKLVEFAAANSERVTLHDSLGIRGYLSVMAHSAAVIGNSSSGVIEAPAMGVPSIDIGARQTGRIKAPSVVSCAECTRDIVAAIREALTPTARARAAARQHPHGDGRASEKMLAALKSAMPPASMRKRFHDLTAA